MLQGYIEYKDKDTCIVYVQKDAEILWTMEGQLKEVLEEARRRGYIHGLIDITKPMIDVSSEGF